MSRKRPKSPAPPEPKPAIDDAPLRHRALAGLKSAHDALGREQAARAAAEEARRAAQRARGERVAPAKPAAAAPRAAPTPAAPARRASPDVWRPDLDKELFAVAMSGVVPLGAQQKSARVGAAAAGAGSARDGVSSRMRRAQAEGDEAIAVRWDDAGTCSAARRGRTFALEALARFAAPQDQLDLHRLEPTEARTRVEEFVRTRRARGLRVVCVVCGVGRHAPDGASVLRDAAVRALAEPPGSREVDAFRTADAEHGGAGAILIALRAPG